MISPRSVSASKRVQGSQRPRTFTSHSVITGGFFLVITDVLDASDPKMEQRIKTSPSSLP
jgi:hypothetical protein